MNHDGTDSHVELPIEFAPSRCDTRHNRAVVSYSSDPADSASSRIEGDFLDDCQVEFVREGPVNCRFVKVIDDGRVPFEVPVDRRRRVPSRTRTHQRRRFALLESQPASPSRVDGRFSGWNYLR